jgi:mercuric ion transport protein
MKTLTGYLLTATALIACPCHLPFTLPLALALLGGTASGAALGANVWLVVAGATVYFVAALAAGLYLLSRRTNDEKADAYRRRDLRGLSKGGARSE